MSLKWRIYYNAVFGATGGLLTWYLLAHFGSFYNVILRDVIAGACIGVLIGGLMGSIDGIFGRSLYRIVWGSFYGAAYGLMGGVAGLLIGELTLWFMGGGVLGRAFGWLCLGLAVGVSEGIANKAPRKTSYGAIGGAAGGFLGGAIFEYLRGAFGSYALSQALGLMILGACIGSLISLVENILRDAWLTVISGRQEGKEFTLERDIVTIGRDERCHVPLFADEKIVQQHAKIMRQGGEFIVSGFPGTEGTIFVNAHPITSSQVLRNDDRMTVGSTTLLFRSRARHL